MSKKKEKPPAPAQPGLSLAKELELYGCAMDPGDFNDLLADLHHRMHRDWNPEQLLYHPSYGVTFVEAVRARAGKSLPEELVMRRLRNIQKAGHWGDK